MNNQFLTAQKFNTYLSNADSHMAKSDEWGAVAYLSQSKYGKYGNSNYVGMDKEVAINNCSDYITGIGGDTVNASASLTTCTTNTYETSKGQAASTTGNITGVYDMSGGSWEYMMGVMADKNGNPVSGSSDIINSGFIGTLTNPSTGTNKSKISWTNADGGIPYPESKYYDLYAYSEDTFDATRRILGDATGELGGFKALTSGSYTRGLNSWYQSDSFFITAQDPFFYRGYEAQFGTKAGIFQYTSATGTYFNGTSFRIVLAI